MNKFKAFLTHKIGPLPGWAYLAIAVAAAAVYRVYRARAAATDTGGALAPDLPSTLPDNSAPPDNSGDNGASGASMDSNFSALSDAMDRLWETLNAPIALQDPNLPDDGSGGGSSPSPRPIPAPQGSHPDYGSTHPPPNNKPGFWWNMSGTETWVTADMRAQFIAYLHRTGTAPGVWAANHPPAAAIMGIAPTALGQNKPSPSVTTAPIKDKFGATGKPKPKPISRKPPTTTAAQKQEQKHSLAIYAAAVKDKDSNPQMLTK